jgi:hypothetical protein
VWLVENRQLFGHTYANQFTNSNSNRNSDTDSNQYTGEHSNAIHFMHR